MPHSVVSAWGYLQVYRPFFRLPCFRYYRLSELSGSVSEKICVKILPLQYSGHSEWDLSAYLFGNILTITRGDLLMLGLLAIVLIIFFCLFIHPIIYVAFDREFARSQGIPVAVFEYLLMMFIALTIVSCLRMVGIVLAISLLTIPQMTANLFTYSFKRIIWLSIGIGFLGCLGGLFVSYHWKVPSGASIIFVSILIYAVCKVIKR